MELFKLNKFVIAATIEKKISKFSIVMKTENKLNMFSETIVTDENLVAKLQGQKKKLSTLSMNSCSKVLLPKSLNGKERKVRR